MSKSMVLSAGLALLSAGAQATDTHPFSVHDLVAMDRISDSQVSPPPAVLAWTRGRPLLPI